MTIGMFDSFMTTCPKCKNKMEFQSKSGECALSIYTSKDLPPDVAMGMEGDVVGCQFCDTNWKLDTNLPKVVDVKLIETKDKARYQGNYNPKKEKGNKQK